MCFSVLCSQTYLHGGIYLNRRQAVGRRWHTCCRWCNSCGSRKRRRGASGWRSRAVHAPLCWRPPSVCAEPCCPRSHVPAPTVSVCVSETKAGRQVDRGTTYRQTTDIQIDRRTQTNRQTDRHCQTDRLTDIHALLDTDRHRHTHILTGTNTDRQTDKQTD